MVVIVAQTQPGSSCPGAVRRRPCGRGSVPNPTRDFPTRRAGADSRHLGLPRVSRRNARSPRAQKGASNVRRRNVSERGGQLSRDMCPRHPLLCLSLSGGDNAPRRRLDQLGAKFAKDKGCGRRAFPRTVGRFGRLGLARRPRTPTDTHTDTDAPSGRDSLASRRPGPRSPSRPGSAESPRKERERERESATTPVAPPHVRTHAARGPRLARAGGRTDRHPGRATGSP